MDNDHIQRPDAGFHACRNNFATNVNGHPADWGLGVGDPLPTGPTELSLLSVFTRTPDVVHYSSGNGRKTPH